MNVLVFTGGDSPLPQDLKLFFDRIFRPEYIIAADSGLDTLARYDSYYSGVFAPDLILGDMDSLRDAFLLKRYTRVECLRFERDKDLTDSELALIKARQIAEDGQVVLLGGCGGRADHFIALYDSFSRGYHADIWLCTEQTAVFLSQDKCLTVDQLKENDALSAARLTSEYSLSTLEGNGLEWCVFAKSGMASISNRISSQALREGHPVQFFARQGSFLIFLPQTALFSVKAI